MSPLAIPVRRYVRPNGQYDDGAIIIEDAFSKERADKLESMVSLGLRFTIEVVFPDVINLCLEDDIFDYKFLMVAPGKINERILEVIDGFDAEDYRRARVAEDGLPDANI